MLQGREKVEKKMEKPKNIYTFAIAMNKKPICFRIQRNNVRWNPTKKTILAAAFVCAAAINANAGGILTNINQSVSFLRNSAREANLLTDSKNSLQRAFIAFYLNT